mmetsp:Transcript_33736/g.66662  ORF Transcript_33736/g.66662 Transcript_33736/m.66662 type:complete len:578 (-) Transcript_33736:53-1786(-)
MKFYNSVFTFMAVFLKKVFAQLEYSHDHLTCFRIKDSSLKLQGVVLTMDANQAQKEFTINKCELQENKGALRMCIPSTKKVQQGFADPSLGGLVGAYDPERCLQNDFLCYKAMCTKTNKQRLVADQFNKKGQSRKVKFVKKGIEICTPAWKLTKKGHLVVIDCGSPTGAPAVSQSSVAPSTSPSGPTSCGSAPGPLLELLQGDGSQAGQYGYSVAAFGDTVVVGDNVDLMASSDDGGSAYVFSTAAGSWTQTQVLVAPNGAEYDEFGHSVSVSADTIVVGAPQEEDIPNPNPIPEVYNSGAVHVFSLSLGGSWTHTQKLSFFPGQQDESFGYDVAVDGDVMVVGTNIRNGSVGAAYIFRRYSGLWAFDTALAAMALTANDLFGNSVAMSGDIVVVGAPRGSGLTSTTGCAYVFELQFSMWVEVAHLYAADGAAGDTFGSSVSVSGETVVIGAYMNDNIGNNAGAAYVFSRSSSGGAWVQTQKLLATDRSAYSGFGFSVAISGDNIAVGAANDSSAKGATYTFSKISGTWSQTAKLVAMNGSGGDANGSDVGISCSTLVMGAPASMSSNGFAYVTTLT